MGAVIHLCLQSAIWITTVQDLSAAALYLAISQTQARFGAARCIYSDNGTNLRGVDNSVRNLKETLEKDELDQLVKMHKDVMWKFGSPAAPWEQGGVERFVRTLKQELLVEEKIKGRRNLNVLEFETVLNKIAAKINDRALIYFGGIGEHLTPNQLILGNSGRKTGTPEVLNIPLMAKAKLVEEYVNTYLDKWDDIRRKELVNLNKWPTIEENLTVGEMVLILDKPTKGGFTIGRIINVFPDPAGLVRTVEIQYSVNGKIHKANRSIRGLSRIDVLDQEYVNQVAGQQPNLQVVEDELMNEEEGVTSADSE